MPALVRWSLKRRPPPDKLLRNECKERMMLIMGKALESWKKKITINALERQHTGENNDTRNFI